MISRSVAQIATASMRTSTSARLGTGTGFSVGFSSLGLPSTQAFMVPGMGKSGLVFTPGAEYMGAVLAARSLSSAVLITAFDSGRNGAVRLAAWQRSQIEKRNDLADQFALFGELLRRLIGAQRAAGDIDLALFTHDDVERLLVMAGLRPVQDELVVGEMRLDAAAFQGLRRLDVGLEKFGQKIGGELDAVAPLAILLRALLRDLVEHFVQFGHETNLWFVMPGLDPAIHASGKAAWMPGSSPGMTMRGWLRYKIKLTDPNSPNSSASRIARRSAIFSRPPWRLSL